MGMVTSQADDAEGAGLLARHPVALALGGGMAAGFGSSFIPMNAIEGFVTAYGIAELLPAAAPPLGETARLALSAGIGTLTAGALLALLPRVESDDMGFETAIQKAGEAGKDEAQSVAPASKGGKLAGWLRSLRFGKSEAAPGTITDFSDLAPVRIRNGDQHPDAPVRAPIRASSDLNEPVKAGDMPAAVPLELGMDMTIAPSIDQASASPMAPSLRFAPPSTAEWDAPAVSASIDDDSATAIPGNGLDPELAHEAQERLVAEAPAAAPIATEILPDSALQGDAVAPGPFAQPLPDLDHLSVAELLERLETGLARRRQDAAAFRSDPTFTSAHATIVPIAQATETEAVVAEAVELEEAQPYSLRPGDLAPPDARAEAEADAATEVASEAASDVAPFPAQPLTDEEVTYLPPSILSHGEPMVDADEGAEELAIEAPQEDDMDAALRDALATLRHLSDRQRNS